MLKTEFLGFLLLVSVMLFKADTLTSRHSSSEFGANNLELLDEDVVET